VSRSAMPSALLEPNGVAETSARQDATTSTFHLGYRKWLDGMRGVAVLMVLAFHLQLLPGGSLGVDVFFVLSGFLITNLLVEEWQRRGTISFKKFYWRRALRLVPAFYTLLALYLLGTALFSPADQLRLVWQEVLVAGTYVANWIALHKTHMPAMGHTWSLAVEEQFYLIWPVLLFLMLRMKWTPRRMMLLICLGIIASAVLRMYIYNLHRTPGPEKAANVERLYAGLDTRADSLLVGCLTGLIATYGLIPTSRRFQVWIGVLAFISVIALGYISYYRCYDHSQFYHGLFTAVALMVAVIIVRLLLTSKGVGAAILQFAPLVGAGRISYGLYLIHIPLIHWLDLHGRLGWQYPLNTLSAACASIGLAVVSFFVIERPFLRLKGRFR